MTNPIKILFFFYLINSSISVIGQTLLLPNEICIFSFETNKGKIAMLCKDKENTYLIYRFGTKNKIEFEFPQKTKDSWSKFKYSHYSRGGGKKNSAEDLNHISFINNEFQYIIFDSYYSESNEFDVGILIRNTKTGKTKEIKGQLKTKKGKLYNFKGSELLEIEEEL
jgi:hypothetical protein